MKITAFDPDFSFRVGGGSMTGADASGDLSGTYPGPLVTGIWSVAIASNTAPTAGMVLTAFGPDLVGWVTSSNSPAGFGPNSTRVSQFSLAGSSGSNARADHIHDGIGTITASSSNTMQRGTFNLRAGSNVTFGLTDSDGEGTPDTLTINAASGGGGGGGDTAGIIGAGWDGGLSVLVAPHSQDVVVPFTGTITGWKVYAMQSGTAQFAISKTSYASFPTLTDIIGAGTPPSLSSTDHNQSSSLASWTVAVTAGDILRFTLSSVSSIFQVVLALSYSRP